MERKETGVSGEELARRFLEGKGLTFRAANVRSPFGEVDLIMEDQRTGELVFVEVKTRRGSAYGAPEESITPKKHAKLRALVEWYRRKVQWRGHVRLDVVGVVFRERGRPEVRHTAYIAS